MKKGTTKISVHNCITCTSGFHTGNQFPRPTAVKIYFEGEEERWVQICEDCWHKLDRTVRKQFDENRMDWFKFFEQQLREKEKK